MKQCKCTWGNPCGGSLNHFINLILHFLVNGSQFLQNLHEILLKETKTYMFCLVSLKMNDSSLQTCVSSSMKSKIIFGFNAAKRAGKVYWDNAHQQFVLTHVCMFCFQILPVGLFPHTSLPYHVNNVYTQLRGLITNTSTNEQRYCLLVSQMIIFSSVQPVYAQTTNSSFSIIKSCDKFVINQAWRLYWALCPLLIL